MSAELGYVCFASWLLMGGLAFGIAVRRHDVKAGEIGALFLFCLLLAPFMLGIALIPAKPSGEPRP